MNDSNNCYYDCTTCGEFPCHCPSDELINPKTFTDLSSKIRPQLCCECGDTDLRVVNTSDIKEFVRLLKLDIASSGCLKKGHHVNYLIDKLAGDKLI